MTIRGDVRLVALILGLSLVALMAPGNAGLVRAQALDDEIKRLLDNNCTGLEFPQFSTAGVFGPELTEICRSPPTTSGSSSGGGAASTQGSALSIQNSLVQSRLERAKGKGGGSAPRTSWLSAKTLFYADQQAGSASTGTDSGLRTKRLDIFGSASYEDLDRNSSRFEDGYDSSVFGGVVGLDYQFTDTFVAGFAAGYRTHKGDYSQGGDFEMTAIEPSFYASYLPTKKTYLQFVVGFSAQDFDVDRNINFTFTRQTETPAPVSGLVGSSTDSNAFNTSAQVGYDIAKGSVTFGPRVGLNYSSTDIDAFSETGTTGLELDVEGRTVRSFQATAGIFGTVAISGKSAVWLPQGTLEYVREFDDEASILTARFVQDQKNFPTFFTYQTNDPDGGFVNAEVGLAAVFKNGIQAFINLRTMLGNSNFDSFSAAAGVRFEL
jgi:uncharacterized protein YhjY with autotransporter beta-barrel domain